MPEKTKTIAVIRVRGRTGLREDRVDTMRLLGLTRVNHCVIVKMTPQNLGMVRSCKDYLTGGEVDKETLAALVEKRGKLSGDKKVTEAHVKASGFGSFGAFADGIISGDGNAGLVKMKRVFRLHPPRKGHKGVKRAYPYGALGNRGAEINELIRRMM